MKIITHYCSDYRCRCPQCCSHSNLPQGLVRATGPQQQQQRGGGRKLRLPRVKEDQEEEKEEGLLSCQSFHSTRPSPRPWSRGVTFEKQPLNVILSLEAEKLLFQSFLPISVQEQKMFQLKGEQENLAAKVPTQILSYLSRISILPIGMCSIY